MCELLGMECNVPTDIVFSFSGLRQRGGRTGPHADGWGLAFYDGRAARVFLEPPRRPRELWEAVADVGAELGALGSFNFLLGDGRHLYARCATRRCYIIRKAPFGHAALADDDVRIDFSEVTTPRDRVAVVA